MGLWKDGASSLAYKGKQQVKQQYLEKQKTTKKAYNAEILLNDVAL